MVEQYHNYIIADGGVKGDEGVRVRRERTEEGKGREGGERVRGGEEKRERRGGKGREEENGGKAGFVQCVDGNQKGGVGGLWPLPLYWI